MIFTRSWLSEFIDIEAISDAQIMDTLNKTGIEVAAYKKTGATERGSCGENNRL